MARTGAEYIEALKTRPPNLWYKGEKVEDPTTHPVFRGIVRTMAALYDLQHDPATGRSSPTRRRGSGTG